ncbi:MAG: hypothetical protein GXO66_09480 [Euryarchaeota archaeon]|nr:hypothetical protein [Euryarchaeota archaeon]
MLAAELLSTLEGLAERSTLREQGGCYAASAFFAAERYPEVEALVAGFLEGLEGGELISCQVSAGRILDQGQEHFEILRGRLFEFYDYEELSSSIVRLYHLRDPGSGREWCALYVDETSASPWWAEEV